MDESYWHNKWEKNDIAFHQSETNPVLVEHFHKLTLEPGSRVFVPLCGKTLDIAWLLSKGYRVVGAELNSMAIEQLFEGLGIEPQVSQLDKMTHYSAKDIDIFVGDIFDVSGKAMGQIDAVYDRAALVALPEEVRKRYSAHLMNITGTAPQLLVTFEYDQSEMPGPPFSISNDEVGMHYSNSYDVTALGSDYVPGGLKGKCEATENVWLLQNS